MFKYIEFDELGAKFIKCMNCSGIVAERFYVKIKIRSAPPRIEKVLSIKKLGQYRQIRVALSDGSYMEPIVCGTCASNLIVDHELNPDGAKDLMEQAATGNYDHDLHSGKSLVEAKNSYKEMSGLVALKKISRDRTWQESHTEAVGIARDFKNKQVN